MASLLYPDDDRSQWPTSLLPVDDGTPPVLQADPRADALGQTYRDVSDYLARQQAKSEAEGYWTGGGLLEGGHPTQAGMMDALRQAGTAVALGTGAPGDAPAPRLNLERVFSKEGVGAGPQPLDKHGYAITDPSGDFVGTLDTTWNPASKELLINDVAADKGANSLGPGTVRQLRDSLLDMYPGAKVIIGDRISGAGAGRQATQTIRKQQQ